MIQKILKAVTPTMLLVALALPVLAQNDPVLTNTTQSQNMQATGETTMTNPTNRKTIDLTCIQNAVEKRDSAIIAAWDTLATAIKSALQTRKEALKAAWAKTDRKERRQAIKEAWKAWKGASRKAREDFKKAKMAAWKQFAVDRKACGPGAPGDDATGAGADAHL